MNKQECEELFPIGCVVSHDTKEKVNFGKWEKVWLYEFLSEEKKKKSESNLSPRHMLDIDRLPSHSFGAAAFSQPIIPAHVSYKRIS